MLDYLHWQSDVSLEQVFSSGESFSYPTPLGDVADNSGSILYLSALKEEKSRSVLMLKTEQGISCITPQPYSLRTRINEYGGKPFWLFKDQLFFANSSDQCLYRQQLNFKQGELEVSKPVRVTPLPQDDCVYMYLSLIHI